MLSAGSHRLGIRLLIALGAALFLLAAIIPKSFAESTEFLRALGFSSVTEPTAPLADQTVVRKIDLSANDIVVDPNTQTIYASVPSSDIINGNKIAPINPVSGAIGTPVFIGSEPGKMAISDNGQYIYTILGGAAAVRRFNTSTKTAGLQINFGVNGDDLIVPAEIAVQPGHPSTVAISRLSPFPGVVAIYDDDVQRPVISNPATTLTFSTLDPTRIYGIGPGIGGPLLSRFSLNSNGVTSLGTTSIIGGGASIYSGGRLYLASGQILEPESGNLIGTFTGSNINGTTAFTIDQNVGRAYFLTSSFPSPGQPNTLTLRVFDLQTFTVVGTVDLPNIVGPPTRLIRWGSNGLAFCTTGGFVYLVQTSLIPSADPVPTPTPTPTGTPTPTPTPPEEPAFTRIVPLLASDLIYDPVSQRLYAASPSRAGSTGNSVVPINPTDGSIGSSIFVGSEPSKLARSDNGQYLYVGLDGSSAVRRVNLATQTADLQFSLGTGIISSGQPNLVADIEVAPGNAQEVAVSMRNTCCSPSHEGVAIFDDGIKRGPVFPLETQSNVIEFSASAATLYGLDTDTSGQTIFHTMNVTPTGVVATQTSHLSLPGFRMEFDAGRMYFNSGLVLNPEVPNPIGIFPGVNPSFRLVLPDSTVGRTFFVDGAPDAGDSTVPGTVHIQAFDQNTFLPVGTITVAGVIGGVRGFVRWGVNGLAFCTGGGQVFLIQSNLVSTTNPAPTPTPTPTATPTPTPVPTPGPGELRQLSITTNDLVVDPNSQTIFASVPSNASANANTVTPIDPVAGVPGAAIPVGTNPNKLAISDNGAVMYVSLDGTGSVRKVDVSSRQPGLEFLLGSDPVSGPYQAEDMAVAPGHPETLAIARQKPNSSPRHSGVVIFDNGILRSTTIPTGGNNRIEYSRSPEVLYGQNNDNNFDFGFRRIGLASCGIFTLTTTEKLLRGFGLEFKVDNGIGFASDGRVIDPEAGTILGVFKLRAVDDLFAPPALIAPEVKAGRIYYLVDDGGSTFLRVFNTKTFLKVGELSIPGVSGTASSLVRWGSNGLAFRTSTGQVFLLQNSLIGGQDPQFVPGPIPATPTTQLSVHVTVTGGSAEGININITGGLSTSGVTNAAGNVLLTNLSLCPGDITVTLSKTNFTFTPASITLNNPINANLQFTGTQAIIGLVSASQQNVPESIGKLSFLVSRSNNFAATVSVTFETVANTASERSDFNATTGTVRFGPNENFQTINVLVTDDALVEGTESFTIRLKDPVGAAINPAAASVTINILDNDTQANVANPLSDAQFFVRQHYQDFLNRAAADDPSGFNFWTNEITACNSESDQTAKANCFAVKRINVSAAFFLSTEFQQTGYLVHRFYTSSFPVKPARPLGLPRIAEFLRDTQGIGTGVVVGANGWEQKLEQNKQAFALSWVARDEFLTDHPLTQTAEQFVDSLFQNNEVTPTTNERVTAITAFGSGDAAGRAASLRSVAESQSVIQKQNNSAFVMMQYFGYLRRNPDDAPDGNFDGYQFWLNKLNNFNGNFVAAEMVKAFLVSTEYQQRFGQSNFDISH